MFERIRILAVRGLATAVVLACTGFAQPAAAQNFLGAVDFAAFSFAPRGWALCDGQLLPISQNQALFSLLGTTFGGDGRVTFALPDMRSRSPMHAGNGEGLAPRTLGQRGGVERVTLTPGEVPSHRHTLMATDTTGNQVLPTNNSLANDNPDETYVDQAPNTDMNAAAIGFTQPDPHENMAPFTVISCIIAMQGIFPSRN